MLSITVLLFLSLTLLENDNTPFNTIKHISFGGISMKHLSSNVDVLFFCPVGVPNSSLSPRNFLSPLP